MRKIFCPAMRFDGSQKDTHRYKNYLFIINLVFKHHKNRLLYLGERPHICTICKKGFIKGSALTQHLRRHTNLKNVKTDIIDHSIQRKAHNSDAIEDEQIIVCYETDDTIKEYLIKESSE